jgi:hypothetical protein
MASPPVSENPPLEPVAPPEQALAFEPTAAAGNRPVTPPDNIDRSDPIPKQTPQKYKLTKSALYSLDAGTWSAKNIKIKLFQECMSSFVGFVPVDQFLESFLPWQRDAVDSLGDFPAYTGETETKMYGPFVSRLKHTLNQTNLIATGPSRESDGI